MSAWPLSFLLVLCAFVFFPAVGIVATVVAGRNATARIQCISPLSASNSFILGTHLSSKPFSILTVADVFDPDTAVIWLTQMDALVLIRSAGEDGMPLEHLRPMHRKSANTYPELYEDSNFEGWLQFLEDSELVKLRGSALVITPVGSEFLQVIEIVHALPKVELTA